MGNVIGIVAISIFVLVAIGRALRNLGALGGMGPSEVARPLAADPARDAVQRAEGLLKDGDTQAAREAVQMALGASHTTPDLLWALADVEFADGDLDAGMTCLAKAVSVSEERKAAAVSRQIHGMSDNGLWREALEAVEHLPPELRDDRLVRAAVGDFYSKRGCHGHAAEGYGAHAGLPPSAEARRRLSWLVSGGPSAVIRHRVTEWEGSRLLAELRRRKRELGYLDAVPGLGSGEVLWLKTQIEKMHYEWWRRWQQWWAVACWQFRLLPLAVLPVWLILVVNSGLRGEADA